MTPDAPTTVLTGDKLTLQYPAEIVTPGTETTKCVLMRLSNDAEVKVHVLHNMLSSSSHHLIVYKDDDPRDSEEKLVPFGCEPFTGALNATGMIAPVMITQRADDLLELPNGVAYTFAPHQMIKLEMHYLNSSDDPVETSATVEFGLAEPATVRDEASILFIGSPDLKLAAGESKTVKAFFTVPDDLDLSASKIFAITGHTHHLGTDMQVRVGTSKTDTAMSSVYAPQPFSWSEPETTRHDPEFSVPVGGGFDFQCSYTNTTGAPVKFGESANDEMCFFWAYYYPSQGSRVCIHTDQLGGQDACCPGSPYCSLIEGQF